MTNIETYADLVRERERLERDLDYHREGIANELEELKDQLKPIVGIVNAAKKVTSFGADHPAFKAALGIGAGLLARKTLLGSGGWIARMAVPFVLSKLTGVVKKKHQEKNFFHRLAEKLNGSKR